MTATKTPPRPSERVEAAWDLTVTTAYTRSKRELSETTGVATGTIARMRRACNWLCMHGHKSESLLAMGWPSARDEWRRVEREYWEDNFE